MKNFLIFVLLLIFIGNSCSQNLDASIYLNKSKLEVNEGLKVWGNVTRNGVNLEDASVHIKVNNKVYCHALTNSSGEYECSFKIEKIGSLNVSAWVAYEKENKIVNKTLIVFANFGQNPSGKNIICREKFAKVRNIDGSIGLAKIKICGGKWVK
ncbi:MAG: hypothetical protein N3E38_00645 [Candidatus Aenigmarchaeota archaeon]|nr:hypothetical protein [Candidatus Aenigmarchaeota archaeon]